MKWSFTDRSEGKFFKELNLYKLDIDEFYMMLNNNLTKTSTYLYSLHDCCVEVREILQFYY